MWLCVDHYQSAGWVSGCTHTRAHSALLYPAVFVGARIVGEDVPRRQRYCSCLPLISSPSLPLPWGADSKQGHIAPVFGGDLWSQR